MTHYPGSISRFRRFWLNRTRNPSDKDTTLTCFYMYELLYGIPIVSPLAPYGPRAGAWGRCYARATLFEHRVSFILFYSII